MNKIYLVILIFLLPSLVHKVMAQDHIPGTSGFSRYFLVGIGNFNVESNLLVYAFDGDIKDNKY